MEEALSTEPGPRMSPKYIIIVAHTVLHDKGVY